MKKHVLFLSYYFPPQRTSAVVRTGAIARALVNAAWKVTVVTVARELLAYPEGEQAPEETFTSDEMTVIGTGHSLRLLVPGIVKTAPNSGLNRLIGGILRRAVSTLCLDREIGWRNHALAAASAFKPGEVDLVLSSGGPWVSHLVAAEVAERLRCPYVLDYRDLWSGNPHTPVRWRYITRRERGIYRGAAAILAVAPSMEVVQQQLFGLHRNYVVLPNGYRPSDFSGVLPMPFQEFALVYAGQFIPPIRVVDPLFRVVRRLMDCHTPAPWAFHYFGHNKGYVQEAAARFGVESKVRLHGYKPRREVLSAIAGAGVVFVVASVAREAGPAEAGIVTGKVFEAIGLAAPFVVVAPHGADIRAVVDEAGGGRAFSSDEVGPMTEFVSELMGGANVPYRARESYSWEELGKTLSDALHRIA